MLSAEYTPQQVGLAYFLKQGTLSSWHTTHGLEVGTKHANGRRIYSLEDAALVGLVAQLAGHGGPNGYFRHDAAVALANKLRAPLNASLEAFKGHGAGIIPAMSEAGPCAVCRRHQNTSGGGWDVAALSDRATAAAEIAKEARSFDLLVIDFASLLQMASVALSRPGIANV